jgi:hypothetical protein
MPVLLASGAWGAELRTSLQTCTTPDCGATVLQARINKSDRAGGFANLPIPWVAQLYANKNECLRLHVTAQNSNTELVAIAPGTQRAWRNDNSGHPPCRTCPLLKIRTNENEEGWFLVQVHETSGGAINAGFTLHYARYGANNPNCNASTQPLPAP